MKCRTCGKECVDVGFGRCEECAKGGVVKNNITVGESNLKVWVNNALCNIWNRALVAEKNDYDPDDIIDKTLSTPLPPVEDCVDWDMDKLWDIIVDFTDSKTIAEGFSRSDLVDLIIANSKSILKWRKQ